VTGNVDDRRRCIVLGLDGSEGAGAALQWCLEHAAELGVEVLAVYALDPVISVVPTPVLPEQVPNYQEQAAATMLQALQEWCAPFREAGVPFRSEVLYGPAVDALQQAADDEDALMIVVGRRARSGFAEILLGSVPHDLTHRAMRPVLVVPVA
jgi:nucleotide-binding universal stress UspA family protein